MSRVFKTKTFVKLVHQAITFVLVFSTLCAHAQSFIEVNSGVTSVLYDIYFNTNNVGFCVGVDGVILKSTDGGITWNPQNSGLTTQLRQVLFTNSNTGYIVGESGKILKTTDGGTNWELLNSGTTLFLTKISVFGNAIYVSSDDGYILKSTTEGNSWETLDTGTSVQIFGTFFTSANVGYAVGDNGTIVKTIDGGLNWDNLNSGTTWYIQSIYFTDANNGYAVGGSISTNTGIILRTNDAGVNWTAQTMANNYFGNIRFLDSNFGYISGGSITGNTATILKTMDGGDNWYPQDANSDRQVGLSIPSFIGAFTCGLNGSILKTTGPITETEHTDTNKKPLQLFPNPSTGKFQITSSIPFSSAICRVSVFSATGESIFEENYFHEVDLSFYPKGIYFIKIEVGDMAWHKKIVIE